MIVAGGGEVLDVKPPYSSNTGATHLLTEQKYAIKDQVDYSSLASNGVPVLKPIYLNDFISSLDKPPSLDDFLIDDFKPHWESKKRSRISTDTPTNAIKKSKSVFGNV